MAMRLLTLSSELFRSKWAVQRYFSVTVGYIRLKIPIETFDRSYHAASPRVRARTFLVYNRSYYTKGLPVNTETGLTDVLVAHVPISMTGCIG